MKRITAIFCLLCLLSGLMLPALAEEAEKPVPCTLTDGCTLEEGHEGNCALPEGAKEEGSAPCTLTDGCTLKEGHEGDCVLSEGAEEKEGPVPCTLTDGCTLEKGHEGDCVLPEQPKDAVQPEPVAQTPEKIPEEGLKLQDAAEGEEPAFCLWIQNGDKEIRLTTVTGEINAQIRWRGESLKKEQLASYEGVSIEENFVDNENHIYNYKITPNPGGTIIYRDGENSYSITVSGTEQSGPMFCYDADGNRGNSLQLSEGQTFNCKLYYQGTALTTLDGLKYDNTGLSIEATNNNGETFFTIKMLKAGDYLIRYNDDENSSIRVHSNSGSGSGSGGPMESISDAGVPNGLYFYFGQNENNRPNFQNKVNFENSFSGLLYVVTDGTAQLIRNGANLTVSPETGLSYRFVNGCIDFTKQSAGSYTLSYKVNDSTSYTATVNVTEQKQMYAKINDEGTLLDRLTVTEGEPLVVQFYDGDGNPIVGKVNGSDNSVQIVYNPQTQLSTLTVGGAGTQKFAIYTKDDATMYFMPIDCREASYLAADIGKGLQYDLVLDAGQEVPVSFFFGTKSAMRVYSGEITASEGLTLTRKENGAFLSATAEGDYTLSATVEGKTYFVSVKVMPALSGGSLFALAEGSGTPLFSTAILQGETRGLHLCYGSYGSYETLGTDKLTVSGSSVTVQNDGSGGLTLQGSQSGQTLLQYQDGDGIVHNYAIKCYANPGEAQTARYSPFATDATVTLPYGGDTLSVGFAYHTADTMYMWPGSSVYLDAREDTGLNDALCLGAMKAQGAYAVGELADPGFYNSVSNVHLSVFAGTDSKNLQLGQRESVSWQNVRLSQFSTYAEPYAYFSVQLLMTFDVQLEGRTCRFYRVAPFSYKAAPHDDVTVDITSADVLNTLLSDSRVLIGYLEDHGYPYNGGSITLNLPDVAYDKIIVSQVLLTGSGDYMATLTLKGSAGTTMPGLFSKGFLTYVDGIQFVNTGKNMPNGKNCGILVDNRPTSYQPDFDWKTLQKYHPDFQNMTDAQAQEACKNYNPAVPTTGNAYNIGAVTNCTFSGFEYAMYSDDGGIINSGTGNTVTDCDYGYYLDTAGSIGNSRELNFRENTFRGIGTTAVYLGTLPSDLDPYYIRFQDNKFYETKQDFHVKSPGNYYFQRNYYDEAGSRRSARLTEEGGAEIYTCPCRSLPNRTDKLWIYPGQRTAIFQSQASEMTVDPACIKLLPDTLTVPVLNEKQQIVAEWTIVKKGGEGA